MAGVMTNDMEFLIDCVKKRPGLYSKSVKEYSDPNLKKKLWEEVCSEAVPGWEELDAENRKLISAEVQRKWNNLRTCFSRELKAQRTKTGPMATKRRKYIYFENLLFLKSCMSEKLAESNKESQDHEEEESPKLKKALKRPAKRPNVNFFKSFVSEPPTECNQESSEPEEEDRTELKKELMQPTKQPNTNFQETFLHTSNKDLDEDKNFVLSLVPTLKSLTEDENFQAKIEILQILRKIKANKINVQKL